MLNERIIKCVCLENVVLNKSRSLTNYSKCKYSLIFIGQFGSKPKHQLHDSISKISPVFLLINTANQPFKCNCMYNKAKVKYLVYDYVDHIQTCCSRQKKVDEIKGMKEKLEAFLKPKHDDPALRRNSKTKMPLKL